MAKLTIKAELGTKNFQKQIANLKADLQRYMKTLEGDAKVPVSLRMSAEERRNLETTIEKTRNQLVSLEQQAAKTGDNTSNGFDKATKSLKRFALSLFGIRSVFSVISRASNTYLSQNETTANKLNAIWVALGNALAPIIEIIADGVLKLIGYLNVFLRALGFNVDLTKNMNRSTKAIKGTTKAMKELNNEVYSFDEISKQSKDTSLGGIGGGSDTNGFVMPELNQDVVNFLEKAAHLLKDNWGWLVAIGAVIAGYKVASWLSGLSKIIGGGTGASATGLLGLSGILKGLLAMELITITVMIITHHKEAQEVVSDLKDIRKNTKSVSQETNDLFEEELKYYKETGEERNKHIPAQEQIRQQIQMTRDDINKTTQDIKRDTGTMGGVMQNTLDTFLGIFTGEDTILQEHHKKLDEHKDQLVNLERAYFELYKTGQITLDEFLSEFPEVNNLVANGSSLIHILSGKFNDLSRNTQTQTDIVNSQLDTTKEKMKQLDNTKVSPKIELKANTSKLTSIFDALIKTPGLSSSDVSNLTWVNNSLKRIGLAKGGIVNLPGKGVPLTNVVTGEKGHEGFIPMDNEESMDLIGQSVARHVVINLTNNTMLDSRVIAREQLKIQDNQNFITNGRGV